MKLKRSARLVDMTRCLLTHPQQLWTLSYFSGRYESAKSSISEDLDIIKHHFESVGAGDVITVAGASGGVKYIPKTGEREARSFVDELISKLQTAGRLLPGGYLYMTDILGIPRYVNGIGRLFATAAAGRRIDVVLTMETKGIPLAYATATQLDVPVVIARRASRITEGSTVSINYVSGSRKQVQSMAVARRSLHEGANVMIVDDFMKAGGTVLGMRRLAEEFRARVAAIGVFMETRGESPRLVSDYLSLLSFAEDENTGEISVQEGNFFEQKKEEA